MTYLVVLAVAVVEEDSFGVTTILELDDIVRTAAAVVFVVSKLLLLITVLSGVPTVNAVLLPELEDIFNRALSTDADVVAFESGLVAVKARVGVVTTPVDVCELVVEIVVDDVTIACVLEIETAFI